MNKVFVYVIADFRASLRFLLISQWTNFMMDTILKKVEIRKFITTALKSIVKLVKLQSLVAKRCKMSKPCKVGKFCILLYYKRKLICN